MTRSTRGRNAEELPPTWGVSSRPGVVHNGCPGGGGSGSVTSTAARSRPPRTSVRSAPVSTTGPHATLTSSAPDAVSQILLALPLCLLYESSIWISYLVVGRRNRPAQLPEPRST